RPTGVSTLRMRVLRSLPTRRQGGCLRSPPEMHALLRALAEVRPLRDPILIAGFADHAGATAAAAVSYLVERWDAELVAEFDEDEFFDFTVRRPSVHSQNGKRVLEWPTSRLYVASPVGAS